MKKTAKILSFIVALALIVGCIFAFAFTANAECTEHVDASGNGLCDTAGCSVKLDGLSALSGYSIDLTENITVNFCFDLAESVIISNTAYFDIAINGRTFAVTSSAQGGGEDCIFQIKQNGDVCLNNRADHVIGNISADKRVVVRVAVDFKNETYTAYDGSGNVITSCAMVLPTKAKNQGFTTFDEWRTNRLNLYLLYMQARVSADGAALGINSILIEEGNAFTK